MHIPKEFASLMGSKWTNQRNQSSLELITLDLMVTISYDCSCRDCLKFAQEDIYA
jgi:hypothetical protein